MTRLNLLPPYLPLPPPFLSTDFAILELLIELSYSNVYTKRTWDGPPLPRKTLLHLIKVKR